MAASPNFCAFFVCSEIKAGLNTELLSRFKEGYIGEDGLSFNILEIGPFILEATGVIPRFFLYW
jgi:hypothetical protein